MTICSHHTVFSGKTPGFLLILNLVVARDKPNEDDILHIPGIFAMMANSIMSTFLSHNNHLGYPLQENQEYVSEIS